MKKIVIFLLTCALLLSFAACGKDGGTIIPNTTTQPVTASDSTTHFETVTITQENTESVTAESATTDGQSEAAGTTVSSGSKIEASLSDEGSTAKPASGTTAKQNDVKTTAKGNATTKSTTTKPTAVKPTTTKPTTTKPVTTKPTTTKPTTTKPTTTKPTVTETTTAVGSGIVDSDVPASSYVAKYVVPVFESGTYTIVMNSTDSTGSTAKTTLATSGGKTSMTAKFDGVNSKMIMSGEHLYVCMPLSSMATGMTEEEISMFSTLMGIGKNGGIYIDLNKLKDGGEEYSEQFNSVMAPFSVDGIKYVSRSNVTKNGVKYICEQYKTEDGTVKFYFSSTSLKMIEQTKTVSGKTTTETIMIDSISNKVASDAFSIPSGYKDVTTLINMMSE